MNFGVELSKFDLNLTDSFVFESSAGCGSIQLTSTDSLGNESGIDGVSGIGVVDGSF